MTTSSLQSEKLSNIKSQVFKSSIIKVNDNLFNCPLILNTGSIMNIQMRIDGFINATSLCKAGSKEFSNWYQNKQTKVLIQALESDLGFDNKLLSKFILFY